MRRLLLSELAFAACLALTATATANNDCCWDWAPGPGAQDVPGSPGPLPPGPQRPPQAPAGWAQCTPTTQPACFERQTRQAFLPNYRCVVGSHDPNDFPPFPGAGFGCERKVPPPPPPPPPTFLAFSGPDTAPPGVGVTFEGPVIPTMSEYGMMTLAALLGVCGIWMLRRRG